jgi:hypothetical protein
VGQVWRRSTRFRAVLSTLERFRYGSYESAASNAPSPKGSASAAATTTSTPGNRPRQPLAKGADGSAAATFASPSVGERGREGGRPAAHVEGAHPPLDAREGDQRCGERRTVAATVKVVGVG